jgi:hypothetical protein
VEVVSLRSRWGDPNALFVGFKGGDNTAQHGDLDLGTFVLDALGQRWAVELGADNYDLPGYWGKEQRWRWYRTKTAGQNTLVLNGSNQNTQAKAAIVAFNSSAARSYAIADLSEGYEGQASHVRRGVEMLGGREVIIQDEVESEKPVELEWGMHTTAKIAVTGKTARLTLNGKEMSVTLTEPGSGSWSVDEIKLDPPQDPLTDTRKLRLSCTLPPPGGRVVVVFFPEENAKGRPAATIRPLSEWGANQAQTPR